MKLARSLLLVPFVVNGLRTKYDTISVNTGALIYQGFYMYDKKSSPRAGPPGNGESFIEMAFNVTKKEKSSFAYGDIEAIIASEEYFSSIGYIDNGKQVVCCDAKAVDAGECTMEGKLIIKESLRYAFLKVDEKISNRDANVFVHLDIPKEGKYYIILALCDPTTTNLMITGESLVVNPYGHVPATLYGSIPFNVLLLFIYSTMFVLWLMRCVKYSEELMSIHYLIFVTLVLFIFDILLVLVNFNFLNKAGFLLPTLNFLSITINTVAHTIVRVLMIIVCLGLGVSKSTLGSQTWRVVLIGLLYFLVSLWDSMSNSITTPDTLSFNRIIPSAVVDSVNYFWILQSLLDTIQELEEKKQSSKLEVFMQLRNVVVILAIVSVAYNIAFSYVLLDKAMTSYWKYQWFFTEGIWSCFYCIVIVSVMYLWSPNDHSLAYANHIQVSTEDKLNDNEYGIDNETLQDTTDTIRVSAVEGLQLKPMSIKNSF